MTHWTLLDHLEPVATKVYLVEVFRPSGTPCPFCADPRLFHAMLYLLPVYRECMHDSILRLVIV